MGLFKKDPAKEAAKRQQAEALQIRDQALAQVNQMQARAGQTMDAIAHMDINGMMAYAQMVQRIQLNGVAAHGTVMSARSLGATMSGIGQKLELQVQLTDGPGAGRTVTITQDLMGDASTYPPGSPIAVRVNGANPDEAMVWASEASAVPPSATAPPAAPLRTAPADDTIARLEQLGQLRDSGAISPAEFEQQKARILGSP